MATLAQVQAEIGELQASVTRNTDAVQSAIVFIQGTAAMIASLKQQLADAIAAGADPAALQAIVDSMNSYETTLDTKASELGAAIIANTPTP